MQNLLPFHAGDIANAAPQRVNNVSENSTVACTNLVGEVNIYTFEACVDVQVYIDIAIRALMRGPPLHEASCFTKAVVVAR